MDLSPLLGELNKQTPKREIVIDELDKITDPLRAGYPTTDIIDVLFGVFTKLILYNQWHIQQYALSCTKYLFENSSLSQEGKVDCLNRHIDFINQVGKLLSDIKREVREMAAQCCGHIALHIGEQILKPEFGIREAIFSPSVNAFAIEGQMMALGRLALAFRIVAPNSLGPIVKAIIDTTNMDQIANPSENGYVFWYSSRALLLLITNQLDPVLIQHAKKIQESRDFVLKNYHKSILECAISRLSHSYVNCRRASSLVVSSIFSSLQNNREEFILSLIPEESFKWVQRDGHLSAISSCIESLQTPLSDEFLIELVETLSNLVNDEIECDSAPSTQKTNANSWAAKCLVHLLKIHDESLYETIQPMVVYLLNSTIAPLLDAGVFCLSIIKSLNRFDSYELTLRCFKNLCHSSFPIRDLSKRTLFVDELIREHYDDLVQVLLEYAGYDDNEIKESACKAFQIVVKSSSKKIDDSVIEMAQVLAVDECDPVCASAIDLLKICTSKGTLPDFLPIVTKSLKGESEEPIIASLKLLKTCFDHFSDETYSQCLGIIPLLAYQAISSEAIPSVSAYAQVLIAILSSDHQEIDEEMLESFMSVDFEAAGVEDLEEICDYSSTNVNSPASIAQAVAQFYVQSIGMDSISDFAEQISGSFEELDVVEFLSSIPTADKSKLSSMLSYALTKFDELEINMRNKLLQSIIDAFADETTEEKQLLYVSLFIFGRNTKLILPDPTPIALSHHNETFAKSAQN